MSTQKQDTTQGNAQENAGAQDPHRKQKKKNAPATAYQYTSASGNRIQVERLPNGAKRVRVHRPKKSD